MKKNEDYLKHILGSYQSKRHEIKARLEEFKKVWEEDDEGIFAELCFCILTPQSRARTCDLAVQNLVNTDVLFKGTSEEIRQSLSGVRFPNNKARYVFEARGFFTTSDKVKIKKDIERFGDAREIREWLVSEIRGLGYKEASHFLRNIGKGEDLVILDRHILKNLRLLGVIEEETTAITKRDYLRIESKLLEFTERVKISPAELDLLLWSEETDEIFK